MTPIHGYNADLTVAPARDLEVADFRPEDFDPLPQSNRRLRSFSDITDAPRLNSARRRVLRRVKGQVTQPRLQPRERWSLSRDRNADGSLTPNRRWLATQESPSLDDCWDENISLDLLEHSSLGSTVSAFSLSPTLSSITPSSPGSVNSDPGICSLATPTSRPSGHRRFSFSAPPPISREDLRFVIDVATGPQSPEVADIALQLIFDYFPPPISDEDRFEELPTDPPPLLELEHLPDHHNSTLVEEENVIPPLVEEETRYHHLVEEEHVNHQLVEEEYDGPARPHLVEEENVIPQLVEEEYGGHADHHLVEEEFETNLRPAPTMADQVIMEHSIKVVGSIAAWNEEFKDMNAGGYPVGYIQDLYKEALEHKRQLFASCAALEVADPSFTGERKDRADEAKAGFVTATRAMLILITDKTATADAAAAAAPAAGAEPSGKDEFKRRKVTSYSAQAIDAMHQLVGELQVLTINRPDHEKASRIADDRLSQLTRRSEAALKDGRNLAADAADVNMLAEADGLERQARELQAKLREVDADLGDIKVTLGVVGTGTNSGLKLADIKPPTFSGDSAADYFQFAVDFDEFLKSRTLSHADQLTVMKKTCLQGVAYTACRDMETVEEVKKYLKLMYGNPQKLMLIKIQEFNKLGDCNKSSPQLRRDWLINALYQIESLLKLATEHDIHNWLFFSDFMSAVHHKLPFKMEELFIERMELSSINALDREEVYRETILFIKEQVNKATYDAQYELAMGPRPPRPQRPTAVAAGKPTSRPPGRSGHAAITRAEEDEYEGFSDGSDCAEVTYLPPSHSAPFIAAAYTAPSEKACKLCQKKHDFLFYCEKFAATKIRERFKLCRATKACMRCLRMDANVNFADRKEWFPTHEVNCQTEWYCKEDECADAIKGRQYHFLMCNRHYAKNKLKLPEFIKGTDNKRLKPTTRFFFSQVPFNYQLDTVALPTVSRFPSNVEVVPDISNPAIFMIQVIETPEKKRVSCFFDSGCNGAALSDEAVTMLETTTVRPGPVTMGVAGGGTVTIQGGEEQFWLPTTTPNQMVSITGLNMANITAKFPKWPLAEAFAELQNHYLDEHPGGVDLPPVPDTVGGGHIHILLGIRYLRYFPKLIYNLPCGLAIYAGQFRSPDGLTGVLGGPHKSWARAANQAELSNPMVFLSNEMRAYQMECRTLKHIPDLPWVSARSPEDPPDLNLGFEPLFPEGEDDGLNLQPWVQAQPGAITTFFDDFSQEDFVCCAFKHCNKHTGGKQFTVPAHWEANLATFTSRDDIERYIEFENSGSEVSYRCMRCRNCADCRRSEVIEQTSLESERQQALMEKCLFYDEEKKLVFATLPFILNPLDHLKDNRNIAEKFLNSQISKLAKKPEYKPEVLKAHWKLRDKGFVMRLEDLPENEKEAMEAAVGPGTHIPWSIVVKEGNETTPARQVFNASAKTATGFSLNNILAKGENSLPKILHLLLRFSSKKHAFSADISMAYNSIKLRPEFFIYQKFLWKENLDMADETIVMVIRTLIYGVICAGGMTTAGFNLVANYCMANFPQHWEAALVVLHSMYMDDVMHPTSSREESLRICKSLDFLFSLGTMSVKAYTFSGLPPDEKISSDGLSVGALGYNWWPVSDEYSVNIKDLYLGKVVRGRSPPKVTGSVKEALAKCFTRRILTGKLAAVFDPLGLATPVTSRLKLNLSEIVSLRLGWDDPIPPKYLDLWVNNLEDIRLIRDLRFGRSAVHPQALTEDLEIIVSMDASETIAVAAIHARSQLPDGSFTCKLLTAKNKLVSLSTIPRAELRAAVLGASLAHIVRQSLGDQVKKILYITDSTVVLFWLHQDQRPLQTAVRNAVIEVRRLSDLANWFHVASGDNIADFGTRHAEVADMGPTSEWVTGKPWMRLAVDKMPLRTKDDINLSPTEKADAQREVKAKDICGVVTPGMEDKLAQRYAFSKYLVDPCLLPWPKMVRVLAFVMKFISILKTRTKTRAGGGVEPPPTPAEPIAKRTRSSAHFGGNQESGVQPNPKVLYPARLRPAGHLDEAPPAGYAVLKLSSKSRISLFKMIDIQLTQAEISRAERYFFLKATKELKQFAKRSDYEDCSTMKDGILYYNSRILEGQGVEDVEQIMSDLSPLYFCNPVVDRYSPIAYSIMCHAHTDLVHHRSSVSTLRESRALAFILRGRDLSIEVRDSCVHCRRFKARLLEAEFGKTHSSQLTVAPAYWACQIDLFGPYTALCEHNHRARVPVWGLIFKDPSSGCIAVYAMAKYDAGAFLQAYGRHVWRFGHPAKVYIDGGSQLIKACRDMEICWTDISESLNGKYQVGIEFEVCPVGGHNHHGMVERAVKSVKELFDRVYSGLKLDLFGYETAFQWVANELNNLPICLGSRYQNLDSADLITPNRLVLGRSNRRAPTGYPRLESPSRQIAQLDMVARAWWKVWLTEKIQNYIPQPPKWHQTSRQPEVGDIIVFLKADKEATLGRTIWRLGRIIKLKMSGDGVCRSVDIEYQNSTEETRRTTYRSIRKIAILHREGDLELIERINAAQKKANQAMIIQMVRSSSGEPAVPPAKELEDEFNPGSSQ